MRLPHAASGILVASIVAFGGPAIARASNGLDSPDNGVEQVGRGSAWFVRANDPLAAFYNPAALVTQATSIHLGAHLMMEKSCFARVDTNGQPVSPGQSLPGPGAPNGPPQPVCTDNGPFPNPQLAATFRISKDFAIGLAVVAPHAAGNANWPESLAYTSPKFGAQTEPAPNRYLLVSNKSILLFPTLSAGYAITDHLSVGAGFVWGIASVQFTNFAETVSPPPATDAFYAHQDVKAQLSAKDLFIPGFILSGLWQATERLDVAVWYKWSDAIRANANINLRSQYWLATGAVNPAPDAPGVNVTNVPAAGTLKFNIPMEAKVGLRYHSPRENPGKRPAWAGDRNSPKRIRDPMSEDLFDIEADFTWANDSSVQNIELRFQPGIAVAGTPGTLPQNADIPHDWRDVVGVRLGGEFVPVPSVFALRAGGFFESKGQDDKYLNLDFDLATKLGLSGGATVRLGPIDVSAAYAHTFYGTLDNAGQGAVHPLSGDGSTIGAPSGDYRGRQVANGGKLTTTLNEVALGGTMHF